jgi:hypothetical protein
MTPAATAAQGRVRWGALGCRISWESSEEEAETRKETGAAGVKEVKLDVFLVHVHRYETSEPLLVPFQVITVLKGLTLYETDATRGVGVSAEPGARRDGCGG